MAQTGRNDALLSSAALERLLALLRAAPEPHLALSDAVRLTEASGHAASAPDLLRQLDALVDRGVLARLPSAAAEPVYDTDTEPHSHLIYEDTGQIVDLHVSAESLLAILRQTLAERRDGVEIVVRVRGAATA